MKLGMMYKSKVKGKLPLYKYPTEMEIINGQRRVCEVNENDVFMLVAVKKLGNGDRPITFLKFLVRDCTGWLQTTFDDLESPMCNKFFEEICQQD